MGSYEIRSKWACHIIHMLDHQVGYLDSSRVHQSFLFGQVQFRNGWRSHNRHETQPRNRCRTSIKVKPYTRTLLSGCPVWKPFLVVWDSPLDTPTGGSRYWISLFLFLFLVETGFSPGLFTQTLKTSVKWQLFQRAVSGSESGGVLEL